MLMEYYFEAIINFHWHDLLVDIKTITIEHQEWNYILNFLKFNEESINILVEKEQ